MTPRRSANALGTFERTNRKSKSATAASRERAAWQCNAINRLAGASA